MELPGWIRLTHLFNILFISMLMRSGLEILASMPKLYLTEHCTPGKEWLKLTRWRTPKDRTWISLEEEAAFPSWLALPGGKRLGLGRHWHFASVAGWIITGTIYIILLFVTPQWRHLVPQSWSIFPGAWHAFTAYLSGHLPEGHPLNPLQELSYFAIIFIISPLTILTGAAMSPALVGRFPLYLRFFGGKQIARSIHFCCLVIFVGFTIVHTVMVILHGLPTEAALIVLGSTTANHALALGIGIAALAGILALHIGATRLSISHPRAVQHMLGHIVDPMQRTLSWLFISKQHYAPGQESSYFRVNGFPPRDREYAEMVSGGFEHWRLEIGGLVDQPQSFSLDDLRAMPKQVQVTKHNCIQGWTAIAEWGGVPLKTLLDRCQPYPNAKFVVLYAMDNKSQTAIPDEDGGGHFYEALALPIARHPQTILAYEMNGKPLPVEHGAPLRLRVEVQLGFKMVKWVQSIELVEDLHSIGLGQGGWREDNAFYSEAVAI